MAQITIWLKHLIAMVILAGCLELVLPDNQLKSVAKLIMGLAIILFLLQPLYNLAQLPVALTGLAGEAFSSDASNTPDTDWVMGEGIRLRQQWQRDYEQELQQELEAKLRKALGHIDGVTLRQVVCRYQGTALSKVKLMVAAVAGRQLSKAQLMDLQQQAVHTTHMITALPPDQIEIIWGE